MPSRDERESGQIVNRTPSAASIQPDPIGGKLDTNTDGSSPQVRRSLAAVP